jgi:hypothetical protein
MTDLPSGKQDERFYPSPCPICEELALEFYLSARKAHFECGRCGAFDIAVAAKSVMSRKCRQQRQQWLAQARKQASQQHRAALVDDTNEP